MVAFKYSFLSLKSCSIWLGFFTVMTITGCSDSAEPVKKTTASIDLNLCQQQLEHTDLYFDSVKVRIFEPDDLSSPTAWQGPVCIAGLNNDFSCIADLSIVKKVSQTQENGKLKVVDTFSGSETQQYQIDFDTCKLETVLD